MSLAIEVTPAHNGRGGETVDIRIEVTHRISDESLASLRELERRIMSQIDDALARFNTSVDAAVTRVQGDIAGFTAQIADLKAQGDNSPAVVAALAAAQAKLDALDPAKPDVLPPTGGGGPSPPAGP